LENTPHDLPGGRAEVNEPLHVVELRLHPRKPRKELQEKVKSDLCDGADVFLGNEGFHLRFDPNAVFEWGQSAVGSLRRERVDHSVHRPAFLWRIPGPYNARRFLAIVALHEQAGGFQRVLAETEGHLRRTAVLPDE